MTLTETARWLKTHDGYLILTHFNPDGDTVGSAVALCRGLRQMGKTAFVKIADNAMARWKTLAAGLEAPEDFVFSKAVSVDTASFAMLLPQAPESIDLAIDHHGSHSAYASEQVVEPDAACGEIIYRLLKLLGVVVTPVIAEALYVAIATDTGCFRYGNTTAQSHTIAAALMETGFDFLAVNEENFLVKSMTRVRAEYETLSGMELLDGGRIAIITLTDRVARQIRELGEDPDEVSALTRTVLGVVIGVTIKEREGHCKVSLRTARGYSAADICGRLGGGGHAQAAGCQVEGDIAAARTAILAAIGQVYPFSTDN